MGFKQPLDDAGGRYGASADVKFLLGRAKVGNDRGKIYFRALTTVTRGLGKKIIKHRLAAARTRTGEKKAATAERSQDRFGDTCRTKRPQGGVEGIAAFFQNDLPGLCRFCMTGGDNAF